MENIEKWRYYTKDLESPDIFIDWTIYWTISAALQRRVWINGGAAGLIYPNLSIVAVAPPGIGKSSCARLSGQKILRSFTYSTPKLSGVEIVPVIPFSAENSSMPSLVRQMADSTRSFSYEVEGKTKNIAHCSLAILLSEEMTSLFSKQNEGVSDFLNQTLDCQDYEYRMKTKEACDSVKNPCATIFGCTVPGRLNKLLKQDILQAGFTARTVFLYANEKRFRRNIKEVSPDQEQALKELYDHIFALTKIAGEVKYSPEAKAFLDEYYENGHMDKARVNTSPILDDYYSRKKMHIIKLSMILHFLDNYSSIIDIKYIRKAIDILAFAELTMHLALGVSGRNPLYELSIYVHELIKQKGPMTRIQLYMHIGKDAREEEFDEILRMLLTTNRLALKEDPKDHKKKYFIL